MAKFLMISVVGLAIFSCSKRSDSTLAEKISGTYVKEYSFKVVNQETGAETGIRTIRDSIFIQPTDKGFQVSNKKWALNDYDNEGWRSAEHFEDRPWPAFKATFIEQAATLNSDQPGLDHALFINLAKRTVS